jgi:hypothetical protein
MKTGWRWVIALMSDPELIAIVVFCAIGLLIAINLIVRFGHFATLGEP